MKDDSPVQRLPVFLSSTYDDLVEHRKAVVEVLNRFEAVVRGMELFGARPGTPKDECLAAVRDSRIYIGLFAMRYGSIDPESGRSLTHLELEEAERRRLPALIYLLDEKRQPVLPVHVDTGEEAQLLRDLKSGLKRRYTVSFFTTPDDLARRLSQDLPPLLEAAGVPLDKSELERIVETIPRLTWLSGEQLAFLKSELGALSESFPSEAVLREVIELLLVGDRLSAAYLVAKVDSELSDDERRTLKLKRMMGWAKSLEFDSRGHDLSAGIRGAIDICMSVERELQRVVRDGRDGANQEGE